jgi:predicted glycosyltransferase involved in capsule biosynthesis
MLMMRSDLLFLSDEEVLKSLDAYKKIERFKDVKKMRTKLPISWRGEK